MIAFDSPEGATLRGLKPSRRAILAIWLSALEQGEDRWATWAREALTPEAGDAESVAMRFIEAARAGEEKTARQLWAVLGSCRIETADSTILQTARDLRSTLPF